MLPGLKDIKIKSVKRVYGYFYPYVSRFRSKLILALLSGFGIMAMDLLKPWPIKTYIRRYTV